jgi:hypothetical protein
MTPDEVAIIRQALYVAADTRIADLCGMLSLTTSEASKFREQAWDLHEELRP